MKKTAVRLAVQVVPNASRSEVAGEAEGVVRIRLQAPPIDGRANEELVRLLSRLLGLPKSAIDVVQGQSARKKMVALDAPGLTPEQARTILLAAVAARS